MSRRPASLVGAVALVWLVLTTGVAAAESHDASDLGGAALPGGTGSTTPDQPTAIGPGLWADTLGGSEARNLHHFTYQRRIKDSTVHIGVVGAPATADTDGIKVDAGVVDDSGSVATCGTDYDSTGFAFPQALLGAAIAVGPSAADATDRPVCLRADTIQIAVSRYVSNVAELPIAIKVVEEAPVSGATSLPEPEDEVAFEVPDAGEAKDLPGATSFQDAPQLDPVAGGTTLATELAQGDEQLWRVGVQWGQQVVVRATAPQADEAELEGVYGGVQLKVRLIGPTRDVFALNTDVEGQSADGAYDEGEAADLVAGSRPVLYRNRFNSVVPDVPGEFWVAVSASPAAEDAEGPPIEVPVEVTVAVSGQPGGEPSYPNVVVSPDDSAGPEGYSPDKPFLVADGTFSAVASGNPVVGDEDDAWLSGRRVAGLGVGALSVVCLAAGVVRLRARR
ncbi:hypothetical protein ASE01_03405 [Nocardioides sp. Root190]|uniref:hypothetical protein n=1 Tax=Nocardioides sp. Root190 TaxID=1736488 RepID=UPI0006F241A4|nr:hypothetical protein [Nocardioides sp. Root190]KRB78337.1 hypothetical protein ASE01_03405 [Nocardioides sp. Root190]